MGRYSANKAYACRIRYLCDGCYRLSWIVDRYYADSRLRHPTLTCRDTDKAGALRFSKKHGVSMPESAA